MFFFPYLSPDALAVGILLNLSLMLRRIVECQRKSKEIKKWSMPLRIVIQIVQFGMDILSFGLIVIASVVVTLHCK